MRKLGRHVGKLASTRVDRGAVHGYTWGVATRFTSTTAPAWAEWADLAEMAGFLALVALAAALDLWED